MERLWLVDVLGADQVIGYVLLDLALILVVARLVGRLFTKIGQPRVVGEIVAGILLGPTLLGPALWPGFVAPEWMHCQQALAAAPAGTVASPTWCLFPAQARVVLGGVGQLALLLFMFLTGLEIDSETLRGKTKGIVLVGLGVVGFPLVMGFAISPVLATDLFMAPGGSTLGFSLFVGSMLAVTAFPVMVRILQEWNLTTSPLGAVGIAAAAVCTIAMFVVAAAASQIAAGSAVGSILLRVALSGAYLVAMIAVVGPLMARFTSPFPDGGGLGTGFFATMFIVLFLSGWVAHLLGLTVIVGGFMAGLAMPDRGRVFQLMSERLGELTGTILLPVFLAFSGLGTDFTRLTVSSLAGLALFLVVGIISKWAGGAVFARAGGLTWAEGNILGILMNCRGLLVLVVALVGVQNGMITPIMQLGGVVMALVTTAMTGPLFGYFIDRLPAGGGPSSGVAEHSAT